MVQKPPYRGQSLPTKFPSYPKFAIYPQHPFSSVHSDKHHVSSLLTTDPWASALDTGFSKLIEHVCLVTQSCLTSCDPIDCSPPGSSVHGTLQARILGWVVISFSRGSSQPRKWNLVSRTAGRFFTNWATGKPSMDGEWECGLFVCLFYQIIWEIFIKVIQWPTLEKDCFKNSVLFLLLKVVEEWAQTSSICSVWSWSEMQSLPPHLRTSELESAWNSTWCKELTHLKRPWCWERLRAGGEGDDRGWDGWMASPTRWTWVWVDSGSWWWTGRAGVLRFLGSQSWTWLSNWTELNWATRSPGNSCAHWSLRGDDWLTQKKYVNHIFE